MKRFVLLSTEHHLGSRHTLMTERVSIIHHQPDIF